MTMFPVQEPETDFTKLSKLIYGLPKTGKTTLASLLIDEQGRTPAFIATEDGHKALKVNAIRVTSWLGFVKLVTDIKAKAAELQAAHSCFVIDLVSDLDEMCTQHICEKYHIASLADMEHGKGWYIQSQAFRGGINILLGVLPCVFIAHTEPREDPKTKMIRMDPAMAKKCSQFVNGKVDIIMWIQPSGGPGNLPQVVIKPTINLNAGSRFPNLIRPFTYDPKNPAKTIQDMSNVFKDRLAETTPVQGDTP